MVEPTSCALHGMEVLDMQPGSDVLIFGAGPTGQVLAQLMKMNGAATLSAAAPAGPKLDLVGRLAADHVVPMDRKDPEVHRRRLKELAPNGFDYVIEATGAPSVCEEALNFVRRRGTILVYGVYPEKASVRFDPRCARARSCCSLRSRLASPALRPGTRSISPHNRATDTATPRSTPTTLPSSGPGMGCGMAAKAMCQRPDRSRVTR